MPSKFDQPGRHGRVNHRQIAEACGVSTATVSRALSGHPGVRNEVRKQVLKEAERLGYQPDPRLAYLSRLRWQSGRASGSVKVVVLVDRFTGSSLADEKFVALQEAARQLGYELEFQQAEQVRAAGNRLSREYYHRGIRGILVTLHTVDSLPELDWDRFSVVIVGEEYTEKPFHRVGTDWRQGFDLIRQRMLLKAERIGISLVRYSGEHGNAGTELNRVILAEALLQREELASTGHGDIPLFRFDDEDPQARERFTRWVKEHQVDAVLCNDLTPASWTRTDWPDHLPKLQPFCLPWTPEAKLYGISGCSMQLGERLSLALRLLHENLLLDRRGLADLPTKTLVPMKWMN